MDIQEQDIHLQVGQLKLMEQMMDMVGQTGKEYGNMQMDNMEQQVENYNFTLDGQQIN